MNPLRTLSLQDAQRLAVSSQLLARSAASTSKSQVRAVIRKLGCLQIDPIRVVAPSQYLVLWSRLGAYNPAWLDELLWQDRSLFEYWAHAASIVLAENFPIHQHQMKAFATGDSAWSKRARRWLQENQSARRAILRELTGGRKMSASDFELELQALWDSSGWTKAQGVRHLLQLMWHKGEVAVAGRERNRKLWADGDDWYRQYQKFEPLPLESAMDKAVKIAVAALGVATSRQIENHFIKGFYPDIDANIDRLVAGGDLVPVAVEGGADDELWFMASECQPLLEAIEADDWEGRTTVLSPFDNLTTDRERVDRLWGFNARSELYVPKKDRVYGHYVLPILWRERLAGRVDPTFDRQNNVLEIEAVFAEDWSRGETAVGKDLAGALLELAEFLGAQEVKLSRRIPRAWYKPLRAALS